MNAILLKLKGKLGVLFNMGFKYLMFRVIYYVKCKTHWMKIVFPRNTKKMYTIEKENWMRADIPFFFHSREQLYNNASHNSDLTLNIDVLPEIIKKIQCHTYRYFNSVEFKLGQDYDWITNPETGYKYDIKKHWSEIDDYSKKAGDIKYVWEKARFTFVYDLIRYDFHFNSDQSKFVFSEIESFIDKNPINSGPNYKCSQEISLRILNWTFALYYYRNCEYLTDNLFQKIVNSIYMQIIHVYKNINFSRIAVRNNHAVTEVSLIYLAGLLFPFFKESKKWLNMGKKWLSQEVEYQIYDDGSYLQFSHNYHRVIIQVLTWVLCLSELNHIKFNEDFYKKIERTITFLYHHQDEATGWLPNYGNNDGALFFPLNGNHYRDFRPQLQALAFQLKINLYKENFEDIFWYGISLKEKKISKLKTINKNSLLCFPTGGFYGFRDNCLTTIRCGSYKDRPAQADALNFDIWHNGMNLIRDPGTYKYNTEEEFLNFYHGTPGHNTLSIGNQSQMIKGARFIWYYWTKYAVAEIKETKDAFIFEGEIIGFPQFGNKIKHSRKVKKNKNENENKWIITDTTNYHGPEKVYLHWNINPDVRSSIDIYAVDQKGNILKPEIKKGWYSESYGIKEIAEQLEYIVQDGYCETTIIFS